MKNILFLLLFLLIFVAPINIKASQSKPTKPFPLQKCELIKLIDLGVWDDIFVFNDRNNIILLRGDTLFSLSMADSAKPTKLIQSPYLENTKIVTCVTLGKKTWIFLNSAKTTPFAIEASSGKISWFKIPNLKIPGERTPTIQSYVTTKHAHAVTLMIGGGDHDTWPRDGNRPIYFWMDLQTGKVIRFPIGWDLEYFSANQKVAIFRKPQKKLFQPRPLQAINLETGSFIDTAPNRYKKSFVQFGWTETEDVKPLYIWHPNMGARNYLCGFSFMGETQFFDLKLNKNLCWSTPKIANNFVGFRTQRCGFSGMYPGSFWLLKREPHQVPQLVATNVTDFAMLNMGNCIYITSKLNPKGNSYEAFFYNNSKKASWNILNGVAGFPKLGKHKNDYKDELRIRLIECFGNPSTNSLALCLFTHKRIDNFSSAFPKHTTLRQSIVVTSDGKRFMTDIFDKKHFPDKIWIHNSGKVLTGKYLWKTLDGITKRQVQLSEITLHLE